jgi:hypothetical protein
MRFFWSMVTVATEGTSPAKAMGPANRGRSLQETPSKILAIFA